MTGSGTELDPYIIQNVTDLQAMGDNLASYYELEDNIDASATSGWNSGDGFIPITNFTGQLNGKGFAISSLFISRSATNRQGLFGVVSSGVVIKNVTLTSVDITGRYDVGALVGRINTGTILIQNCSSSGAVTSSFSYAGGLIGLALGTDAEIIEDCSSSCTVSGLSYIGGFVGIATVNIIRRCYATGSSTANTGASSAWCFAGGFAGGIEGGVISECYATGNASATNDSNLTTHAGGFIGKADANINDCYARGNAIAANASFPVREHAAGFVAWVYSGRTIDKCYSTGTTTGNTNKGFCTDNDGTITNCFWDTETSGDATSNGGTGKTTAQMKTRATFADAGWDFETVWGIDGVTNNAYPYLAGGVSIYPLNPLIRVSGIVRTFWAGVGGQSVYQAVLTLGGISTTFIPPIGSREPPSAVAATPTPRGAGYQQADYETWLRGTDLDVILKLFGHFPTYQEWVSWKAASLKQGFVSL